VEVDGSLIYYRGRLVNQAILRDLLDNKGMRAGGWAGEFRARTSGW
jgi:hypothetical protein